MTRIITAAILLCCFSLQGTAQVRMPQPSTTTTIKQDFALGNIELTYSRPNAKGRKIYGDLVPFDKLWRTGANAATKIVFSDPVEIGGKRLDSGTYVIYTIPGADIWEIIINKGIKNWGTEGYKESEDVCRFKVNALKLSNKLETFTMEFAEVKPESCELHLMWAKTEVVIPIEANIKEKLKAQIEEGLKGDKKPYWQAAQFYFEYDINYAKALDNCTKAIQDNDKAYWMWLYKAKIQKEMGDKEGALVSSKRSWELAKEAKNEDYVKMNEDLQRKLNKKR
jgi:hypothetical protein